jgi:hypothetical protein
MCRASEIAQLSPIAERHPRLTLIIDHMGLSGEAMQEGRRAAMVEATMALAKYQNVSVKPSSAPAHSSQAYPFHAMTPDLRGCFDAYGLRRCHWGTDITNSLAMASYRQRILHFTEELSFLCNEDRDWIGTRNPRPPRAVVAPWPLPTGLQLGICVGAQIPLPAHTATPMRPRDAGKREFVPRTRRWSWWRKQVPGPSSAPLIPVEERARLLRLKGDARWRRSRGSIPRVCASRLPAIRTW